MTADNRRRHLAAAFSVALQEMDLVYYGDLTYSTYHLSAGGRVLDGAESRWLRVRWQFARRRDRDGWAASASIPGVAKPVWYRTHEFEYGDDCMRGDLLSVAPSMACAPGPILVARPVLCDEWFAELRRSVEALEHWPTDRISMDDGRVAAKILGRVGSAFPSRVDRVVANHMDLHWCNITAPTFSMLDWDYWGRAPYGYGPATLYCSALLVPDVAQAVYTAFRNHFETSDGHISLLLAADRLLNAVSNGEFPDSPGIADALHTFVWTLTAG